MTLSDFLTLMTVNVTFCKHTGGERGYEGPREKEA